MNEAADAIVDHLYRTLLGRDADDDGRAFFVKRLAEGDTVDDLVVHICGSEEFSRGAARMPALRRLRELAWHARPPAGRRPLVLLHVMKTGGTALTAALVGALEGRQRGLVLTDVLLDDLVATPPFLLSSAALLAGHLPYEALDVVPGNVLTCTIVREPVGRVLSHYWHLARDPAVVAESPRFSLEEFVESPRWNTLSTNYQARALAHRVDVANAWQTYAPAERYAALGAPFPAEHPYPLQSLFDCSPLPADAQLERSAISNLDQIDFVGTTDALDALYSHVLSGLGIVEGPVIEPLNRSDRPEARKVARSLRRRIEERNQVDAALYEKARTRSGG